MENDLLARVYRQYSREIRLYLYVLSKNETLAEDLTQETFLKALLSLPAEHPNVRAWLYTVARNLYYDSRKKDRRIVNDEIPDREDDVHPGPEDTILASERDRALMRAVTRDRAAPLLFGRASEGRRGAHRPDAGKRAGAAVPGKKRTQDQNGGVGI